MFLDNGVSVNKISKHFSLPCGKGEHAEVRVTSLVLGTVPLNLKTKHSRKVNFKPDVHFRKCSRFC